MRKRKKIHTDQTEKLISLGQQWRQEVRDGNYTAADQLRKQATPLFEDNPKFLEKPPMCNKMLYMIWHDFVVYPRHDEIRKLYNEWLSALEDEQIDALFNLAGQILDIYRNDADGRIRMRVPCWLSKEWSHRWMWMKFCAHGEYAKDQFLEAYQSSVR